MTMSNELSDPRCAAERAADALHEECETASCVVPSSRRQFLRESMLSVATAMIGIGMARSTAFAMPLELMERDGWRRGDNTVAYPVPAADGAQIDKSNEVILVRWQGAVYAFNLSCPHQNTALRWEASDQQFQCPKHHSRFGANGDYVPGSGRATRNMDRFAIAKDPTGVRVSLDKMYQEDDNAAEWAGAVVKVA